MTKLIVLCMNEIPIGVYTTLDNAINAQHKHEKKESGLWRYEAKEFVVDAAAKR